MWVPSLGSSGRPGLGRRAVKRSRMIQPRLKQLGCLEYSTTSTGAGELPTTHDQNSSGVVQGDGIGRGALTSLIGVVGVSAADLRICTDVERGVLAACWSGTSHSERQGTPDESSSRQ